MESIKSVFTVLCLLLLAVFVLPAVFAVVVPVFFMVLIIMVAVGSLWGLKLAVSH